MKKTIFTIVVLTLLYSCGQKETTKKDTNNTNKEKTLILPEVSAPKPIKEESEDSVHKGPNPYNRHKGEILDKKDMIFDIRSKFNSINSHVDSYKMVHREMNDETTEGGEIFGYYDNGNLKKIIAKYYGETYNKEHEFYIWKDKLFFVFEKINIYDKPIYSENSKITEVKENRFYIYNDKLIKWIDPRKKEVNKSEFADKYNELSQEMLKLKMKLK